MANFLYDNLPTIAAKNDSSPLAAGADSTRFIAAGDINSIVGYITDIRTVLSGFNPTKLLGNAAATGAVAVALDNQTTQTSGTIVSLRTGGAEKAKIDFSGSFFTNSGFVQVLQAGTSLTLLGNRNAADSSADVVLTGQVTRTTGRIASFQNNSVEKSYVNKDGVYVGPDAFGRVTVADAPYTSLITDNLIVFTSITVARTVTLTTPQDIGHVIVVKDESGSVTGTITITITAAGGTGAMQGGTTQVINSALGIVRLYWSGAKWFVW